MNDDWQPTSAEDYFASLTFAELIGATLAGLFIAIVVIAYAAAFLIVGTAAQS